MGWPVNRCRIKASRCTAVRGGSCSGRIRPSGTRFACYVNSCNVPRLFVQPSRRLVRCNRPLPGKPLLPSGTFPSSPFRPEDRVGELDPRRAGRKKRAKRKPVCRGSIARALKVPKGPAADGFHFDNSVQSHELRRSVLIFGGQFALKPHRRVFSTSRSFGNPRPGDEARSAKGPQGFEHPYRFLTEVVPATLGPTGRS